MLYRVAVTLLWPLLRLAFRPWVTGKEHLPAQSAFVVAANHLSGFDTFALGYALYPRVAHYMAKNQLLRRRLVGALLHNLGAFPAHGAGQGAGVTAAAGFAGSGHVVVIFPTGARERLDREHRPRAGAAFTALVGDVPLVPAAIAGTDGWRRLRRWRVAFGPPIPLDDLRDLERTEAARRATRRLWDAIRGLGETLGADVPEAATA